MGAPGIKNFATLLLGIGLIGLGALFFLSPGQSAWLQILTRYWPVFLILAGLVRSGGFLLDRNPRSPVGGFLLTAIGGIWLSANLHQHRSLLLLLSRYWFWFLLALVLGRVTRQYLHRDEDGPSPRAFSPGGIALMLLVAGAGILAAVAARSDRYLAGLSLHLQPWSDVQNVLLGQEILIEDEAPLTFALPAKAQLHFDEIGGGIEISAGPQPQASIRLLKHIRATDEAAARQLAREIHLQPASLASPAGDIPFRVALPPNAGGSRVSLLVVLPQSVAASIEIRKAGGLVKLTGLRGDHLIRDSETVDVRENTGSVRVESASGAIELSQIQGDVLLRETRHHVSLHEIRGLVTLDAQGGSIEAGESTGPFRIRANRARVQLSAIGSESARPATPSGRLVEVLEAAQSRLSFSEIHGDVAIAATKTPIQIEAVSGDLTVNDAGESVTARKIKGALRITSANGAIHAEEIQGAAVLEGTRDVNARNFRGPLSVSTQSGTLTLATDGKLQGDLKASCERGQISLSLPEDSGFLLDALTERGRVRVSGFERFTPEREEPAVKTGYNLTEHGPRVTLRLGKGEIQLQASRFAVARAIPVKE